MTLLHRYSSSTYFLGLQQVPLLQTARFRSESCRQHSQLGTSISGSEKSIACSAWLSPQDLNPSKLAVTFLPCASEKGPQLPSPRKYTLTHSDITGQLRLSVGQEYNQVQLSGWYLQLFRDEVLAEWLLDAEGNPQLHLFCHISSNQRWSGPIPPALRSRVFQREIPLVLKTLLHGDRLYLSAAPELLGAAVFLHLSSHVQALNMLMDWGILGDEKSWRQPLESSWFKLWWKQRLAPPIQTTPSQLLLEKAAAAAEPAENSTGTSSMEADHLESLETALPAASAACGRANVGSGVQHAQTGSSADSRALQKAGMGGDVVGARELELSCGVSQSFRSSSSYNRFNLVRGVNNWLDGDRN